jgi:hypothetical protein
MGWGGIFFGQLFTKRRKNHSASKFHNEVQEIVGRRNVKPLKRMYTEVRGLLKKPTNGREFRESPDTTEGMKGGQIIHCMMAVLQRYNHSPGKINVNQRFVFSEIIFIKAFLHQSPREHM